MPSFAVDALPEELWSAANLYRFFGQDLHFCVGDGVRTIELNGRQVAHGARPFVRFADAISDESALRRWGFDLGWLVVAAIGSYLAVARVARRVLRRPVA